MSAAPVTHRPAPGAPTAPVPDPAARRPRGPHRSRRATVGLGLLVLACSLVFVVPLYWLLTSALKPNEQIYTWPLTWIPRSIDLGNVVEAWNAAPFDRFFVNSAITTGVGTLLEMGLAIMSAYAFAFIPFRYKKVLFVLVIGSLMLPGHVTLIVNYITVANLGWLNTYQGLILPGIGSAFAMFLLYQHMRTLDPEILQAAEIDGAGHVRRMLTIVVPLTSPMILTATLIVLIGKWNEYVWPLIVTSTADMRTLPIGLLFLRSQEGYSDWGALLAGTVMASAPMLLLFFLAQKRIIGGLAAGALK
ncbi:carbohydrate ABC transporter permease [Brachybacterium sp. AOP25-B2-12]|uniref:carbohydrate ABC transporter permease n=1 Tax=Brachybacterium sp. AOP25-B2-12 TaxID=3457710 RepID=UPI0040334A34